jgi:site-specific DNA-methyltransferase (adenine-specific)
VKEPKDDILPDLSPVEYDALKSSIADHGVEAPIHVGQDKGIIDGKARRRACEELGIECPSIVQHVESEAERLRLRLRLNCNRRHLTGKQKRELVAAYLKTDPEIGNPELGGIVGCDKKTVEAVRRRLEATREIPLLKKLRGKDGKKRKRTRILANKTKEVEAATELVSQLPDGDAIIPFKAAKKHVRRLKLQRRRDEAAANAPSWDNDNIKLYHCRFQEMGKLAGIEPGSIRLILTDPPYGKDWLPQWEELGRFAAEYLQDGGLLVAHSGIHSFDEVLVGLRKHLEFVWLINSSWTHSANTQYLQRQVILSKWRPIPVFSKGTPHLTGGFYDTIHVEGQEKEYHDWQQPLAIFERLIEDFSQPGDVIVDPCGGAFTTAVACDHLRRRCIACDIDKQCVRIGIARLHAERTASVMPADDEDKPVPYTSRWRPQPSKFRTARLSWLPMRKL